MFKVHFVLQYHPAISGPAVSEQCFHVDFVPGDFQRLLLNCGGHCICITLGDSVVYGDKLFKKLIDDDTEI